MDDTGDFDLLFLNITKKVILIALFTIPFFGFFGNICIIIAAINNKTFHNKCGYLIANLSFWHTIMLIFEFFSGIRILIGINEMKRYKCFYMIMLHLFSSFMSKWLMLGIAIDRLLAILIPVNHKAWNNLIYCIIISIPGLLFSLTIIILQIILADDQTIKVCNPISCINSKIKSIYLYIVLGISLSTIIIYSLIFLFLFKKGIRKFKKDFLSLSTQKEMAITLALNSIFFVLSTFIGYFIPVLVHLFSLSNTIKESFEALVVILILIPASCTYYLLFWRARLYRKAFKNQLVCQRCFHNTRRQQTNGSNIRPTHSKYI
uniref:G_PROTEIN_RECEP_F1_2 domain-containing protein n=1 Tax=Strongyloides stercoralis TaxID=6248 RepID=A0A0K0E5I8_STRER